MNERKIMMEPGTDEGPRRVPAYRLRPGSDSLPDRVARYGLYTKRCSFFAAGLAGLLILVGQGTLLEDAPDSQSRLIATIAIVGLVCSALAYVPFVTAKDTLEAKLIGLENPEERGANAVDKFPTAARVFYWLSLVCLIVSGALFIHGMW